MEIQVLRADTAGWSGDDGDDGAGGADDDNDDHDEVQLDDGDDGDDSPPPPLGRNFPRRFLPTGELFLSPVFSASQERHNIFLVAPLGLGFSGG